MTEFYIPAACSLTVFGQTHRFVKGVHAVPDIIANSHEANAVGIKPVEEMTDDEWRLLGLPVPATRSDVIAVEPKPVARTESAKADADK